MDPTKRKKARALTRSRIICILAYLHPRIHLLLKYVEGDCATPEHGVVELPDVESWAELPLGLRPEFTYFEFAHLVAESLAGPNDVTVDFDDDVLIRLRRVFAKELDRLIAPPTHRMQPRIDDEPDRPPHFIRELAELGIRIFVKAHLLAEQFGVQAPAFNECRIA